MARGALAAAVEAAANEAHEALVAAEGTVAEEAPEAPAAPPETPAAETEVETPATGSEPPTPPAGEEEEPPDSFMGVDLSGLPADQRAEIIAGYQEANRATNLAQREAAEARKAAELAAQAPAAPVETPQETPDDLSDEVLAQALGLDLENPDDARIAPRLVPMARVILELKDTVENLQSTTTATSEQARWEKSLDALEAANGPLPVDRTELLSKAVDMRITDPEVAYWAIAGPVRSQLAAQVTAKLAEQRKLGAKGATTPRPSNVTDTVPGALKATNTKDAVKEAAEQVAADLGISWGDAWNQR